MNDRRWRAILLAVVFVPFVVVASTDFMALRYRVEISTPATAEKVRSRSYENEVQLRFGESVVVEMPGECLATVVSIDGGDTATLTVHMSRIRDDGIEVDLGVRELTIAYGRAGMVSWPADPDNVCNFHYAIAKNGFARVQ